MLCVLCVCGYTLTNPNPNPPPDHSGWPRATTPPLKSISLVTALAMSVRSRRACQMFLPLLLLCSSVCVSVSSLPLSPSSSGIALNSTLGHTLLISSSVVTTTTVMNHFDTQVTQSFCSVATSATILNALAANAASQGRAVAVPVDPVYSPYRYYTQRNILEDIPCVATVKTHNGAELDAQFIALHGATLDEWSQYLKCHADVVQKHHARSGGVGEFRAALERAYGAQPSGELVAVNFDRKGVEEFGGGHMSPLAAYHKDAESGDEHVLLLDVSRYKYPPVWLPVEELYDAMATLDSTSGLNRGFVVVSARAEGSDVAVGITTEASTTKATELKAQYACLEKKEAARWDGMLACLDGGGTAIMSSSQTSRSAAMSPTSAGVLGGFLGFVVGGALAYTYASLVGRRRVSRAFAALQYAGDVDVDIP